MLALFCATALPEPIVELIQLDTIVEWEPGYYVTDELLTDDIDAMLKRIYCDPLINNVVSDSQLLDIFNQEPNVTWDYEELEPRYVDTHHYFELPSGVLVQSE